MTASPDDMTRVGAEFQIRRAGACTARRSRNRGPLGVDGADVRLLAMTGDAGA